MDIRRRMINTPPPTADNVFVIDSITFEEINMWGVSGYYTFTENINTTNSLKNFIVENGDTLRNGYYKIDSSQIELYFYDYKIPAIYADCNTLTNSLSIYCQKGVIPGNHILIEAGSHVLGPSSDSVWTFDHIPTTSIEAILFVEFAKQYGADAIKIDGYVVIFDEGWNLLYIEPEGWITHSYTIYGANNGDLTGYIQYSEVGGS